MTDRLHRLTPAKIEMLERRQTRKRKPGDRKAWHDIKDRLPRREEVVRWSVREARVLEAIFPYPSPVNLEEASREGKARASRIAREIEGEEGASGRFEKAMASLPVRRRRILEDLILGAIEGMHPSRLLPFYNNELRDRVEEVRRRETERLRGRGTSSPRARVMLEAFGVEERRPHWEERVVVTAILDGAGTLGEVLNAAEELGMGEDETVDALQVLARRGLAQRAEGAGDVSWDTQIELVGDPLTVLARLGQGD